VLTLTSRYHGESDPEHEIVELEMQEMNEAISTTGTDKQVRLISYFAGINLVLIHFFSGGTTKTSSAPAPLVIASFSSCVSASSAS